MRDSSTGRSPQKQTGPVAHLAAALAYASAGIHVFPLAPRSKVPLIAAPNGGHGLHDATTNDPIIRSWWTTTPTANIGLRTGISFDVIDLDGESAVVALEQARDGREQLHGPVVQTGHGFHWYVTSTGLGNRAGILSGVDFRGQRGYVVAPPSVHPDGHRYRWINPLHEELAPAPQWFIQLLVPERRLAVPNAELQRSRAYAVGALRRELQRLALAKEGTRNYQLNASSFNMGRLVAAGAIDEQEVAAALIKEGKRIGLGTTECERTVTSGMTAGMECSRSMSR
jgi:bifunctional DNA primase/polymerase-like protein